VQSHSQRRSTSPALIQKDPDRRNFSTLEIFTDLSRCRFCDLNHFVLLTYQTELRNRISFILSALVT
ncbi:MAG: hypothetical protein WAJ95_13790, partial [Desulfobacterales bacterium]